MSKSWNCHNDRKNLQISAMHTVYHPQHGQLCVGEKHYDCLLWHPITFTSAYHANKWIESGTIAELQEQLMNLYVDFVKTCLVSKE